MTVEHKGGRPPGSKGGRRSKKDGQKKSLNTLLLPGKSKE
jgi:hypothetical protein